MPDAIRGTASAAVRQDASPSTGGRRLHVLRQSRMPAVLVELGFLTSPEDRRLLMSTGRPRIMAYAIAAGIEEWAVPDLPRPVLRIGDRGDAVQAAQRELGIADDGIFGPETDVAVREFQRAHGLDGDGVIGPNTSEDPCSARHGRVGGVRVGLDGADQGWIFGVEHAASVPHGALANTRKPPANLPEVSQTVAASTFRFRRP